MRVTAVHWQVFLEIAQEFPSLITSKFNGPQGKAQGNELWKKVAARLNGLGYGEKTIGEWRRALTDWKSKVKIKASKLRCSSTVTGGGSCDTPPLTELEEKLLSLMGRKCLEGDQLQELGQCSSKKTGKIEEPDILEVNKESNLVFEVISEPFTAEDDYFSAVSSEHNYVFPDATNIHLALSNKSLDGKKKLKRKSTHIPLSESKALDNKFGVPSISSEKTPITAPSSNIQSTSRNAYLLPKASSSLIKPAQKRRKISSIPKIGRNLENMTSESVETFKNIAKNTEQIARNSSRIADSLEELVSHFRNSK